MILKSVIDYIRELFPLNLQPTKRRAEDPLEYFSPTKSRKMSYTDVIDLSDDDFVRPRKNGRSLLNDRSKNLPNPTETIILDDDTDVMTIRRGNEFRFQRTSPSFKSSTLGAAKYTSTPEDKFYQNGAGSSGGDDDDVILVKETKFMPPSTTNVSKRGDFRSSISSMLGTRDDTPTLKPFTGRAYMRSLNDDYRAKENLKPKMRGSIGKRSNCLDYSIRLDEKKKYRRLLDIMTGSNSSNNSSVYFTPMGKLMNDDEAERNMSRSQRIMAMAVNPAASIINRKPTSLSFSKMSTKDTIKKVLDSYDGDTVEVKDSDSESDVIYVNPPSPKPDVVVEPVNTFKKLTDLVEESSPDWMDLKIARHKQQIDERQKEIEAIKEASEKHAKINKEIRMDLLTDHVNRALQIQEQVVPEVVIEEEVPLPQLTPEQVKRVERVFSRGDPNEVLAQKFNLNITRRDMATLAGLNWLNDEVINFYMNLIIERGKDSKWPKAYAFNTFFYVKLLNSGPQSLRRWTKKVDIFAHDIICVPIHLGMHWCMATIDFRDRAIRYYDSMGSENNKCLLALKKYLEEEHMDKKKTPYDTSDFVLENVKDIPQQMNGSDCGMFACTFAEFLTRNANINKIYQELMPYFRKKMVVEILEGRLLIQ